MARRKRDNGFDESKFKVLDVYATYERGKQTLEVRRFQYGDNDPKIQIMAIGQKKDGSEYRSKVMEGMTKEQLAEAVPGLLCAFSDEEVQAILERRDLLLGR